MINWPIRNTKYAWYVYQRGAILFSYLLKLKSAIVLYFCCYLYLLFIAYELYFDCMNENVLKNIVLSVGVEV